MMFESSNLTESTRIRMLEDRCRLLDEVIALRRERDALLGSRPAPPVNTAAPIPQRPMSYYSQYAPPPPPPPHQVYRPYSYNPSAAGAPATFTSLESRQPAMSPMQSRQENESRHHRRTISNSFSTSSDEGRQVASPFLAKPTMKRGSSVVSPTNESKQAPPIDSLKSLQDTPSKKTSASSSSTVRKLPMKNQRLPSHFRLSANTVVLGKGKAPKEASGNMRLKELVQEHLEEYVGSGRHGKMVVISNIISKIQQENCMAGTFAPAFVRFQENSWWEVTEKECRIKLSATFRDLLSDKYRSSSKSKVEQRRRHRQQQKELSDSEDAVSVLLSLKA